MHVHGVLKNLNISELDREVGISPITNRVSSSIYIKSPLMRRGNGKLEPDFYYAQLKLDVPTPSFANFSLDISPLTVFLLALIDLERFKYLFSISLRNY